MKYPRTPHLPWSRGVTADDVYANDTDLQGKVLVYTEKLDGENTVFTRNTIHARSETGYNKPWQSYMKRLWSTIRYNIPEDITVCGENLYAIHSIEYSKLPNYFYAFAVLKGDTFLSWDDTKFWCAQLNLPVVPEVYTGPLVNLMKLKSHFGNTCEGYVVRNIEAFPLAAFQTNVAKCVRANHVQTDEHWTSSWRQAKLK